MTYDGPWDPISGSVDSRGILCRIVAIDAETAEHR
jgi:hypothetical protein